jgi:hypothetical protein
MNKQALQLLRGQLTGIVAVVITASFLSGCGLSPFGSGETSKSDLTSSNVVGGKILIVPIIYPDRVVELDTRTGLERTVPDSDLIVEDGKVWGRYLRLGKDVEYIMSYHNQLCAPALTVDIDTIGETSRPIRSFSVPEPKYDDCKDEEIKKAAKRIRAFQSSAGR